MDYVAPFDRQGEDSRRSGWRIRGRRGRIVFFLCALCACGSILIACGEPTAAPAPTPDAGTVAEQIARGAPLYAQNCATANCHGIKGEGIRAGNSFSAWPLVGPEFAARNPNAQVVFDVVRSGDEQNLRAMTDQQIYDAIAFELSQNGTPSGAPLTAQNATTQYATQSGSASFNPAALYPPTDGVKYLVPSTPPRASYAASNDYAALRVDQIAEASSIGEAAPPANGKFVLMVLALQDLTDHPIDVDPGFLRLYDSTGRADAPQVFPVNFPIEQLHHLTIQPGYGTAAITAFALAAGASLDRLVYDNATGHALTLSLK